MNSPAHSDEDFLHKEFPKQFDKDQFWHQIKRTVNGQAVSETDIALIVDQIVRHLQFEPTDSVLDLGCGNGALAGRFFDQISRYVGVDFSEYLLEVAAEYFRPHDRITYRQSDIRQTDNYFPVAQQTTKVLIYGCLAYLSKSDATTLLTNLVKSLPHVQRIFIGNLPDVTKATDFFSQRGVQEFRLDDPKSAIGVWWEPAEFLEIGQSLGLTTEVIHMPPEFYGAAYRFDVAFRVSGI